MTDDRHTDPAGHDALQWQAASGAPVQSLAGRLLLALFSGLFGAMMFISAPPTDKAVFFYGFSVFCFAISAACILRGRFAEFFGSLVGSAIFLSGIWYVWVQSGDGAPLSFTKPGPSVFKAILFLIVFGIPGVVYAARTKFGFRRRVA